MHRFLQKALNLLAKHKYEPTIEHKLCAVLVKGGAVISVGYNGHGGNAFVAHYMRIAGKRERWQSDCVSTHAEMQAVDLVRAKTDLRGCKIFVARQRATTPGTARPCVVCQRILYEYGIKIAYYTITPKDGVKDEYGVMRIHNPKSIQDRMISGNDENSV